ncbi:MAG: tRNA lysidine(34) synthetase TilS, partial [Flavobacteriales bacterium]|nr:tRNA lysidine(34) synthetase TilS [Flavobacteriales bacterium]
LETFLINTTRGTGLKGLTGIPKVHGKIVRPLLAFSRDEILQYAKDNEIAWREDSSNASSKYLRNKLRLEVIPKLKEENAQVLQSFKNTLDHLKASQALLEDYMVLVYKLAIEEISDGYRINIEKLKSLPNAKALLYELLHSFHFKEWEDVYHLLEAQSGKQLVSETHILLKDREYLYLKLRPSSVNEESNLFFISEETTSIKKPVHLTFERVKEISQTDANTIFVDAEKLQFPLTIRKWEDGDAFYPFGMQGKKKLSKFFKDEKLSLFSKEKIWLLCSDKQIVWVIGLRADNRFKITSETTQVVKINCQL